MRKTRHRAQGPAYRAEGFQRLGRDPAAGQGKNTVGSSAILERFVGKMNKYIGWPVLWPVGISAANHNSNVGKSNLIIINITIIFGSAVKKKKKKNK